MDESKLFEYINYDKITIWPGLLKLYISLLVLLEVILIQIFNKAVILEIFHKITSA